MPTTREAYLEYLRRGWQRALTTYAQDMAAWRETIDPRHFFGFNPSGQPVALAYVGAFLYTVERKEEYAVRAREELIAYRDLAAAYPPETKQLRPEYADGLPPIPNMFILPLYAQAYCWLQESGVFAPEDRRRIEATIVDSMPAFFAFPEWGAHNRTALRAWALLASAEAFPENEGAADWRQMAHAMASDSIGKWTIEDASLYHPIWVQAMTWYADLAALPDYWRRPTTRYYFEYFLHLLAPGGFVADFGDAHWQSSTSLYLACFERGAREYRDPFFKWAAERLWQSLAPDAEAGGLSPHVVDACLWLDERVNAERPTWGSHEALEELAGKKVVFRGGWGDQDTFLLLNYKPETDYGKNQRDYLKHTISVHAEKAHHGHADENALCLLMSGGDVLLHEGGYRDDLPNGRYRADYYHNRVLGRPGRAQPGGNLSHFLATDGTYVPVDTQKIDFQTFRDVDFSRTRLTDRATGWQWDRTVVYLKRENLFLLFDAIELLRAGTFTFANLLYTRQILDQGDDWFDTRIDEIGSYRNHGDERLFVRFAPIAGAWLGRFETRRHYQQEWGFHQTQTVKGEPGDFFAFQTALVPHRPDQPPAALAARFSVPACELFPHAAAWEIATPTGTVWIGVKHDLEREILQENLRPRYDYASGRATYGPVETDARFVYLRQHGPQIDYAFTEGTGLSVSGRPLFAAKPFGAALQYVGEFVQARVPKWRRWEGTVASDA